MLKRLQHKRLSDEIADQFIALIKNGTLKPGDALPPEREMASSLGVSAPPLREGLKILETLGFVEIQPRSKIVVKSLAASALHDPIAKTIDGDLNMVIQLLEVRKILESWAVSKASQLATDNDITSLEKACQEMKEDFDSNRLGVHADANFHLGIFHAAQNTILSHIGFTLFDLLWQSQKLIRETMFKEDENKRRLLEQHAAILAAIQEKDPQKASKAIVAHLDFAKKKIIELTAST
ncbi:MAG: FadR family transcriptional regulator [Thermodesulfobacteriota bacterium]|nr:FadR family transcriptional regulator [Thermodesulfobacteriota bacterium]